MITTLITTMTVNNLLAWTTGLLALIATGLLSNKTRIGWLVLLAAQLASLVLYYRIALTGLFVSNILFALLSLYAYRKWTPHSSPMPCTYCGHFTCSLEEQSSPPMNGPSKS